MQSRKIRWNRLAMVIAGALGIVLIGCIAVWALAPNLRRILQAPYWKTDVQLTAQAAHKMVDYDLPPNYQELKVLTLADDDAAVIIAHRERPGDMIFIERMVDGVITNEEWRIRNEENLSREMGERRFATQTIGTQKATVRGQSVTLRLFEGTDENGRKIRQVVCAFAGKSGDVLLAIVASEETWDQALVDNFIRSIQ
jgi:hypothetical protein